MIDLPQIHLWHPISTPIHPWTHVFENVISLYESEHSVKLQPPVNHPRPSSLNVINLGNIIESIYDGNLNVIVLDHKDFKSGLDNIIRIIRIMLDHINESPITKVIVFDLVKLQKRSSNEVLEVKNFLHLSDIDQEKVVIRDLSVHSCFLKDLKVCAACTVKVSITIMRELMRKHIEEIRNLTHPREP